LRQKTSLYSEKSVSLSATNTYILAFNPLIRKEKLRLVKSKSDPKFSSSGVSFVILLNTILEIWYSTTRTCPTVKRAILRFRQIGWR